MKMEEWGNDGFEGLFAGQNHATETLLYFFPFIPQ